MIKTSVPSWAVSSTDSCKIHECILEIFTIFHTATQRAFTSFILHCTTREHKQLKLASQRCRRPGEPQAGGSNRCRAIFLRHANARCASSVLTLATRTEMTATAILCRVGSSWLLSQLITSVAAKYLKHGTQCEEQRQGLGKSDLSFPRIASGGTFSFGAYVAREKNI